MECNMFSVELLGDDNLKGVLIPCIIERTELIPEETKHDIAKIMNAFRTVFVYQSDSNTLETSVYSVHGQISDCLYGNMAAIFTTASLGYIRGIETGVKEIKQRHLNHNNDIFIHYENYMPISVAHLVNMKKLEYLERKNYGEYENSTFKIEGKDEITTMIREAKDPKTFSLLRKKIIKSENKDLDKVNIYYDKEYKMVYFSIDRKAEKPSDKLNSREHIGAIVEYLLGKGIKENEIQYMAHVLNNGQYAILHVKPENGTIYAKANARTLVEGILKI